MNFRYKLISKDGIFQQANLIKTKDNISPWLYDKIVSNKLYNYVAWANKIDTYINFAKKALKSAKGLILDIPCGPASFTYKLYAQTKHAPVILSDLSLASLQYARKRILDINPQTNVMFIRQNAYDLVFEDNTIDTILSQGILHILTKPNVLINEVQRVLRPQGKAYFSALVNDRKISALFLKLLHKLGHIAKPLSSKQIENFFAQSKLKIISSYRIGGMLYIIVQKSKNKKSIT